MLRKTQFFFSPVHPLVLQHLVCRHRAAETGGEADQLTAASAGQQRPAVRLTSSWQPLQGRDPSQHLPLSVAILRKLFSNGRILDRILNSQSGPWSQGDSLLIPLETLHLSTALAGFGPS